MQKQPKLDLQTIQPQFQAPASPTTTQPIVESIGDQDQTNFVSFSKMHFFVINFDRLPNCYTVQFRVQQTSQSLQLLFQLPNVQQTGTQSQPQAVLTTINQPVSFYLGSEEMNLVFQKYKFNQMYFINFRTIIDTQMQMS